MQIPLKIKLVPYAPPPIPTNLWVLKVRWISGDLEETIIREYNCATEEVFLEKTAFFNKVLAFRKKHISMLNMLVRGKSLSDRIERFTFERQRAVKDKLNIDLGKLDDKINSIKEFMGEYDTFLALLKANQIDPVEDPYLTGACACPEGIADMYYFDAKGEKYKIELEN